MLEIAHHQLLWFFRVSPETFSLFSKNLVKIGCVDRWSLTFLTSTCMCHKSSTSVLEWPRLWRIKKKPNKQNEGTYLSMSQFSYNTLLVITISNGSFSTCAKINLHQLLGFVLCEHEHDFSKDSHSSLNTYYETEIPSLMRIFFIFLLTVSI